ncbi:hypothetical protein, partial [Salmonella enterica]|uniref:hypothetical protein n=1 Tax=Salmonella enterica TaxID=28901 RepID=UPI00398C4128
IAGMKDFTVTRTSLDRMYCLAGFTGKRRFILYINNHCNFTFRIVTAAHEPSKEPPTNHQHAHQR